LGWGWRGEAMRRIDGKRWMERVKEWGEREEEEERRRSVWVRLFTV
jgi:hypothetical protein